MPVPRLSIKFSPTHVRASATHKASRARPDYTLLSPATLLPPDPAPCGDVHLRVYISFAPLASPLNLFFHIYIPTKPEYIYKKKSFNRSEEDFNGDLRAYNDYLETMEDIIYGLCSGDKREAEKAQARVREYEDGHRGEITKNAAKK